MERLKEQNTLVRKPGLANQNSFEEDQETSAFVDFESYKASVLDNAFLNRPDEGEDSIGLKRLKEILDNDLNVDKENSLPGLKAFDYMLTLSLRQRKKLLKELDRKYAGFVVQLIESLPEAFEKSQIDQFLETNNISNNNESEVFTLLDVLEKQKKGKVRVINLLAMIKDDPSKLNTGSRPLSLTKLENIPKLMKGNLRGYKFTGNSALDIDVNLYEGIIDVWSGLLQLESIDHEKIYKTGNVDLVNVGFEGKIYKQGTSPEEDQQFENDDILKGKFTLDILDAIVNDLSMEIDESDLTVGKIQIKGLKIYFEQILGLYKDMKKVPRFLFRVFIPTVTDVMSLIQTSILSLYQKLNQEEIAQKDLEEIIRREVYNQFKLELSFDSLLIEELNYGGRALKDIQIESSPGAENSITINSSNPSDATYDEMLLARVEKLEAEASELLSESEISKASKKRLKAKRLRKRIPDNMLHSEGDKGGFDVTISLNQPSLGDHTFITKSLNDIVAEQPEFAGVIHELGIFSFERVHIKYGLGDNNEYSTLIFKRAQLDRFRVGELKSAMDSILISFDSVKNAGVLLDEVKLTLDESGKITTCVTGLSTLSTPIEIVQASFNFDDYQVNAEYTKLYIDQMNFEYDQTINENGLPNGFKLDYLNIPSIMMSDVIVTKEGMEVFRLDQGNPIVVKGLKVAENGLDIVVDQINVPNTISMSDSSNTLKFLNARNIHIYQNEIGVNFLDVSELDMSVNIENDSESLKGIDIHDAGFSIVRNGDDQFINNLIIPKITVSALSVEGNDFFLSIPDQTILENLKMDLEIKGDQTEINNLHLDSLEGPGLTGYYQNDDLRIDIDNDENQVARIENVNIASILFNRTTEVLNVSGGTTGLLDLSGIVANMKEELSVGGNFKAKGMTFDYSPESTSISVNAPDIGLTQLSGTNFEGLGLDLNALLGDDIITFDSITAKTEQGKPKLFVNGLGVKNINMILEGGTEISMDIKVPGQLEIKEGEESFGSSEKVPAWVVDSGGGDIEIKNLTVASSPFDNKSRISSDQKRLNDANLLDIKMEEADELNRIYDKGDIEQVDLQLFEHLRNLENEIGKKILQNEENKRVEDTSIISESLSDILTSATGNVKITMFGTRLVLGVENGMFSLDKLLELIPNILINYINEQDIDDDLNSWILNELAENTNHLLLVANSSDQLPEEDRDFYLQLEAWLDEILIGNGRPALNNFVSNMANSFFIDDSGDVVTIRSSAMGFANFEIGESEYFQSEDNLFSLGALLDYQLKEISKDAPPSSIKSLQEYDDVSEKLRIQQLKFEQFIRELNDLVEDDFLLDNYKQNFDLYGSEIIPEFIIEWVLSFFSQIIEKELSSINIDLSDLKIGTLTNRNINNTLEKKSLGRVKITNEGFNLKNLTLSRDQITLKNSALPGIEYLYFNPDAKKSLKLKVENLHLSDVKVGRGGVSAKSFVRDFKMFIEK